MKDIAISPYNGDAQKKNGKEKRTENSKIEKTLNSIHSEGKGINLGSQKPLKTQKKDMRNIREEDIGRKMILPIKRFLINESLRTQPMRSVGRVENLYILPQNARKKKRRK